MITDLSSHIERKRIVLQIEADVDRYCREKYKEDPRTHLGASIMGNPCKRYLWNNFRWIKFEDADGRQRRLFRRGHDEEAKFIALMKGIGFEVYDHDPNTGKQYRISGANGHFGGSLDTIAIVPARYEITEPMLAEYKTHNLASFKKLVQSGVQAAKPQHYAQMNQYGPMYGLRYGLYVGICKDNDALHWEIVQLNSQHGNDLFRKAEAIVYAQEPPAKISNTPTAFECKFCDFAGNCHRGEAPTKNCRSCIKAVPIPEGKWFCQFHAAEIPAEFIIKGCGDWIRIA